MTTNTLTNTIAAAASAVTLAAAVATPASAAWTYYKSGESGNPTNVNCITDGNWVLYVRQNEYVATNIFGVKYLSGGGATLDLSSGVVGTDGTTAYMIESFEDAGFANRTSLESVVLPGQMQATGASLFSGCTALRSARYVPAPMQQIFNNGTFYQCPLTNDVADIISRSCVQLGREGQAFVGNSTPYPTMCGELVLTNLTYLRSQFNKNNFSSLLIDSPNLTVTYQTMFNDCPLMSNVVLRLPNLLTFDLRFGNVPMTNDVADILDPGVTNIYANCFNGCAKMRGCLLLTNLMATATGGDGYCFQGCASLQEIRIGGPLTQMTGAALFKNCTGVTNIVLNAPNMTSVPAFDICTNVLSITLNTPAVTNLGSVALLGWWSVGNANLREITFGMTNAFTATSGEVLRNCTSLSNVVFQGAMPDTATMDHILGYVSGNSSTHTCTIYASRSQAGWKTYCEEHPVSDAERAAGKVPSDCMGVYVTAGGARKAWIVNYKSPQDGPGGFVIRICENDIVIPDLTLKNYQLTSKN